MKLEACPKRHQTGILPSDECSLSAQSYFVDVSYRKASLTKLVQKGDEHTFLDPHLSFQLAMSPYVCSEVVVGNITSPEKT